MPWKEQSVAMKREEFVKRVISHEGNKSAMCREYGISRPTGDKWIARYQNGESLEDQSRAPTRTTTKQTLKQKNCYWSIAEAIQRSER